LSAIGYYIFYCLIRTVTMLPLQVLYLLSDVTYYFTYYLIRYRRQVVFTNLRRAFPENDERQNRQIAKRFYRHYCDLLAETMKLVHMSPVEIRKRVRYLNPGLLDELYDRGKSVIAVIGHYGNWEWLAGLPLHIKYQAFAIYKPMNNKQFDRFFIRLREQYGVKTFPMEHTVRRMVENRRNGLRTITMFLSDQRPIKRTIRYWTTFLRQDTPVLLGAERLAKKLDEAVVFFDVRKVQRGYYEVEFRLITDDPSGTKPCEITEKHVRVLESIIIEKPEYWLWSHRRWRHDKARWLTWAEQHGINLNTAEH